MNFQGKTILWNGLQDNVALRAYWLQASSHHTHIMGSIVQEYCFTAHTVPTNITEFYKLDGGASITSVYTWYAHSGLWHHDVMVPKKLPFLSDWPLFHKNHINGLVQERHNSSALAMELCLCCTNPSISCKVTIMLQTIKDWWGKKGSLKHWLLWC